LPFIFFLLSFLFHLLASSPLAVIICSLAVCTFSSVSPPPCLSLSISISPVDYTVLKQPSLTQHTHTHTHTHSLSTHPFPASHLPFLAAGFLAAAGAAAARPAMAVLRRLSS